MTITGDTQRNNSDDLNNSIKQTKKNRFAQADINPAI